MSAADARASRLAAALLGRLPKRTEVSLGSFGRIDIVVAGLVARDGARAEMVSFGIGRPRLEGCISVDAALAGAMVEAVLRERREDPPTAHPADRSVFVGPLGFGARGVLAGLVARVFEALGAPLSLSLDAPPRGPRVEGDQLVLALEVGAAGARGWAELEVPARWLDQASRGLPDVAALTALTVTTRIQLGRTYLEAGDLAGLARGDAVVFDGQAALDREGAWPVSLAMGDVVAEASLTATGRIQVWRSFRARSAHREEEETLSSDSADDADGGSADGGGAEVTTRIDVTAVLAAAPVEVVAEVGRIVLRGDEVLGIGPGVVLSLGGPRVDQVTLRVGDQDWAEGELVDVDGALAVRVTRVVRPTTAR